MRQCGNAEAIGKRKGAMDTNVRQLLLTEGATQTVRLANFTLGQVHLKDARVLRSRKPWSLGTPEWPMSRAAVEDKFLANATRVITPAAAEHLIGRVMTMEQADTLEEIMTLSTRTAASGGRS